MNRRLGLIASIAVGATFGMGAAASAQEADTPAASGADETIVVTGSRVARSGFDAPTPTTVLTAEALDDRGLTNVGDFLNEIPSFRPSVTNQTNTQSSNLSGATFADLRALGNIRTLTLVDGRRLVPTAATGQVDLNLVPTIMIDRVDVVTGGASAAYGSDAISGVVNIILDSDLDGFKSDVSVGVSEEGDNLERRASLAWGTDFADNRGHLVLGAEYVKSDGVDSWEDREWSRRYEEVVSYAATRPAGTPSRAYAGGVQFVNSLIGGIIVGNNADTTAANGVDVLRGYWFPRPGVVERFNYGTETGGASINFSSTSGTPPRLGHTLVLPIDRQAAYAHLDYELTDTLSFFVDGGYGKSGSDYSGPIPRDTATTGANAIIIRRDNAFLPAQIATIMDANGITSFPMGRSNPDFSSTQIVNFNTTYHLAAGLEGELEGGWSWDITAQYGENELDSEIRNMRIQQNFLNAYDAIRLPTGEVVCRSTTARAAGCVPLNLFGAGAMTPQAIDYVNGTQRQTIELSQEVFAANLRGEPVSTWAGPVSVAVGGEYRKDSVESIVDDIARARGYNFSNPQPFSGEFATKEFYGEAVIPLVRDAPLFHSLDFNGAVRFTDYESSGKVSTWKLGVTWEMIEGLTFRGTTSRDIRAPNSSELFQTSSTQSTIRNPFNGVSRSYVVISAPSPTLQPEEADTVTLGAVYEPSFVPGLSLSVDYYDIDISGAIASYPAQQIIDNCFAEFQSGGPRTFCSYTSLSGTGAGTEINSITVQLLNLASLVTSGVDFELAYRFDLGPGQLSTRLFGTYVDKLVSDDGLGVAPTFNAAGIIQTKGSVIDRAGQVGGFTSGLNLGATSVPHWTANAAISYDADAWSTTVTARFIEGGVIDATLVQPGDANYNSASPISVGPMNVDSRLYFNWSGALRVYERDNGGRAEVYAVVNNILNEEPPFPNTLVAGLYDRIGRAYKLGLRLDF